jgi:hypothetical protein
MNYDCEPDYRWDKHPAADKRRESFRRANSDLTDYEAKVANERRHLKKRPNKGKRGNLRRANSDMTGFDPKVQKESRQRRRRPKQTLEDGPENEEEAMEEVLLVSSDGEEGEKKAEDKKSKRKSPRRAKSDLTSYESKSTRDKRLAGNRRKRRPIVRFSAEDPRVETRPSMTDEEKADMFYTKTELFEMKRERDEEKAEEARERRNRTYGDNSAKLGSIWGDSGNKVKPNKVVSKLHGDKPKEKSESEKKMEDTFDALQLAMAQAKMITGY